MYILLVTLMVTIKQATNENKFHPETLSAEKAEKS